MSSTGFWNKNILEHDLQAKDDDNQVMEQLDGQKKKNVFFYCSIQIFDVLPEFWIKNKKVF